MILVLDSSVAIAWIAEDERSDYADCALRACGSDAALVPDLWHWEVANVLLVFERRGRIDDAAAIYAQELRRLPVRYEDAPSPSRGREEIALARRHQLTVYDAAYLALALANGLPLATLDAQLAAAARAEGVFFSP